MWIMPYSAGEEYRTAHNRRWRRNSFVLAACLGVMAGIAVPLAPSRFLPGHTTPAATSIPRPTPLPSMPQAPAVVVGTRASIDSAASAFPAGTRQIYCMINLPNVAPTTPIRIEFQKLPAAEDYFHHDGTAGTYNTPLKFAYIYGPLDPGKWSCSVLVDGRLVGAAVFAVE